MVWVKKTFECPECGRVYVRHLPSGESYQLYCRNEECSRHVKGIWVQIKGGEVKVS